MTFPFEITINLKSANIPEAVNSNIKVYSGITTFLGPNGAGKTQLLRALKSPLHGLSNGKKVRYISAGRLGPMENYRSDFDGQRGTPNFDGASFGDKGAMVRRHQMESILGDFATLSVRTDVLIKVQERLRKLFKRDIIVDWDDGRLKVFFARIDQPSTTNYSSAREASGLLHLAAILASLYDDEIGCLLIDEPEVSLHPQLQSFLLNEITKVAGPNTERGKKLVFLSTHSTEFIEVSTVKDLASIIFCKDIYERPVQIDPSIDEFKGKKLQALLTRLGQEHKLALFCHTPLLVEGPSDQIMCSALSRKLSLNLEAAGSQILPITGKGQFPVVVKLFRLIGKVPAILADADAITDDMDTIGIFTSTSEANQLASELGHKDAAKFAREIYSDFCQLVAIKFDDIKTEAENHYYWLNRDKGKDELIAKRRSAFCYLFNTEDSFISKLNNGAEWLNIKTRLNSLLTFLEKLGCFVLRQGTIEAYYQYAASLTNDEKPNAASYEVSHLLEDTKENVNAAYNDIIRAMAYCSKLKEISEAELVRDLLLAIVSPALASIKKETTESDLNLLANNLFGVKSRLFKLDKSIVGEDIFLEIHLTTNILDVGGFPLKIKKGTNPIEAVNAALNLK
jgi:hypothetical protein